MMLFLKKLLGWILNIPVLFAHFPGPTLMLVILVAIASSSFFSWLTHQVEAGARAELEIDLAQCRADHAEAVATAATSREEGVRSAYEEKVAIDTENQRVYLEQLKALSEGAAGDKAALEKIQRLIKEMHNDPAFACRLDPLPQPYLDGVRIDAEAPRRAAGGS